MVSNQFNQNSGQSDGGKSNSPGDDKVETFNDGDDATPEQLAQAAADLNSVEDGNIDPSPLLEPAEPQIPPSVKARQEIVDRQAKARQEEMIPGSGVGPYDDGQDDGTNMNAENLYYGNFGQKDKNFVGEDLPSEQPAQQPNSEIPANPEPGEPGLVTVNIDGVEQQVSQDVLIRNFQKDGMADKRLQDATDLLKQAQGVAMASQPTATTPADQSEPGISPTEPIHEPGADDIDYAGIVERIQLGETNEGAEALKDLVTQVAKRQQDNVPPIDPAVLVEQVATQVQDRTVSETARQNFETNYPDIISDPMLHAMAGRNAVEAMIEDFENNGANADMVAEARKDYSKAATAHRAMRQSGQFEGLKTPEQLYAEGGDRTREWLAKASGVQTGNVEVPNVNAPAPIKPVIPRDQRARAATQSPQMRQAPPQPVPKAEKVKTPSEVIQDMRRSRGQFPAGSQVAGRR